MRAFTAAVLLFFADFYTECLRGAKKFVFIPFFCLKREKILENIFALLYNVYIFIKISE